MRQHSSRGLTLNRTQLDWRAAMQSTETHLEHGTYHAYNKQKCRCAECREAARVRMTEYRRNRGVAPRVASDLYRAAHTRVVAQRGKASAHKCEVCGAAGHDWALVNESPRVQTQTISGVSRRWSDAVSDYLPLCRACHRDYDARWNALPSETRPMRVVKRDQTRCPNGHDRRLPGATRLRADGRRECVECARDRVRRYRAKITTRIE